MSDLVILDSIRSTFEVAWTQLQWWASVSFGIIALTHFADKKLNLVLVSFVSLIYLLFTIFVWTNTRFLIVMLSGYGQDLMALQNTGKVSAATRLVINFFNKYASLNGLIIQFCVFATCIGTISYLVYTYRKNSRGSHARLPDNGD